MPVIIAVIVIIFLLIKCESEYPTQNYYKKDVTNDEYKRVLEECEREGVNAFKYQFYKNQENTRLAGYAEEYAKDDCFKERGFIKGGDASQAAKAEKSVKDLEDELNKFAIELSASAKNNIFNPTIQKKRYNSYVITFETSDTNLMKKPSNNALANDAANAAWGAKFCTEELERIIIKNSLNRVEGRILNSEMFLAVCDDTGATSNEILLQDMQNNLKEIQSMINR